MKGGALHQGALVGLRRGPAGSPVVSLQYNQTSWLDGCEQDVLAQMLLSVLLAVLFCTTFASVLGPSALDSSEVAVADASVTTVGSAPNYWSSIPTSPSTLTVTAGDALAFKYSSFHNVYALPSAAAYESCDFSGAHMLADGAQGGGQGYRFVAKQAGTLYIACQVGSHCNAGQKLAITVKPASSPPPPPQPTGGGSARVVIEAGGTINIGAGGEFRIG